MRDPHGYSKELRAIGQAIESHPAESCLIQVDGAESPNIGLPDPLCHQI